MITKIDIEGFKGIVKSEMELRPLTLLTGLNSIGKSTCLQAILTTLSYNDNRSNQMLQDFALRYQTLRNRNINAKEIKIATTFDYPFPSEYKVNITESGCTGLRPTRDSHGLEHDIYYISANRPGFDDFEKISDKQAVGVYGEYIFGTYEKEKSQPVAPSLRILSESETLSSHVDYWLSRILGMEFEMKSEEVSETRVRIKYKSEGIPDLSPRQLGVGVSSLAKILIACLRCKPGDIMMMENPEIHLHPGAQARLGEFFAYIVKGGIQIIAETHSEHLINKIQWCIYKQELKPEDAVVYYKGSMDKPFERIDFTGRGKFSTEFPEGFFDATLENLLEIG